VALVAAALAGPAAAQVGHDPAHSPYQDLKWGQFISVSVGKAFGGGGTLGIGPHSGSMVLARYEFLADRPVSVSVGVGFGQLDRNYADLTALTDRVKGPVKHDVYLVDATFQLNATGAKTWHGLAPYLSAGLGLAFASKVSADASGYNFGTRFSFAPSAGVRAFLSRRLYLRLEGRAIFWNLSYPTTYQTSDPDGLGPVQPLLFGAARKEWAPLPVVHVGLGYAFRRPF